LRKRARAHGAISIVNAIPSGAGAAMGVGLWTEAEVEVYEGKGVEVEIVGAEDESPLLAEKTVEEVFQRAGVEGLGARVRTFSNIPIGRGLKSSSAAANAIALATASAVGLRLNGMELVNLAVDAAIKAGVTITGAFDDASASFFGGINVTDNQRRILLKRFRAPEELEVLILVPEGKTYTRSVDVEALRSIRRLSERALHLALEGRVWEALTLNGFSVAGALDLDLSPAIDALRAGALGAGISGTGPAVAAVSRPVDAERVARALQEYGRVLRAKPSNLEAWVRDG